MIHEKEWEEIQIAKDDRTQGHYKRQIDFLHTKNEQLELQGKKTIW